MKKLSFARKLFTSICMATKTTNFVSQFTSVNYFLPQLFAFRFANMGGINLDDFRRQLSELRTFDESKWCSYWNSFAQKYEADIQQLLKSNKGVPDQAVKDALVKSITYYSVSAWPGVTPLQLQAYEKARELTDQWLQITNLNVTKVIVNIAGEDVVGYMYLPTKEGKYPMVIVTNGLEGTVQELAFPIIKYCDDKTGVFFMEMPGTYAYKQRLSTDSEAIYNGVIEYVSEHPKVDSSQIAMMGVSFGGHWAARMAAVNPNLNCVVASGAPIEHAFKTSTSFGIPSIMVSSLQYVTGAKGIFDLIRKLGALSFANGDLYKNVKIPLLILNGDTDTLVGTQDSLELNRKIPNSLLKLYEDDDHCAMGHYDEWIDFAFDWINMQFANSKRVN